jgi:hypothetical protein
MNLANMLYVALAAVNSATSRPDIPTAFRPRTLIHPPEYPLSSHPHTAAPHIANYSSLLAPDYANHKVPAVGDGREVQEGAVYGGETLRAAAVADALQHGGVLFGGKVCWRIGDVGELHCCCLLRKGAESLGW